MNYRDFQTEVQRAGLTAKKCHETHWQIIDGCKETPINVWANSKRGFTYQVDGQKSRRGTLSEAIAAAGPVEAPTHAKMAEPPPWAEPKPERVGLIRWLWRMLW